MSVLLKVTDENKYLLIRNKLRPQTFGPIGGALKYYSTAKSFLDDIKFEPDLGANVKSDKLKRDLRGFIPAKNLIKFIDWFEKRKDREDNCLHRELREELKEIGQDDFLNNLKVPEFSMVRVINEPLHKVSGKTYLQFRILRIEEFSHDYLNEVNIIERFIHASNLNKEMIWVTSDEIMQGVDNKANQIGSHSQYLLNDKKTLAEDRPWTVKK